MPQTRISDDVWALAEEVSDRMGLNSPRLAIEAIVRVYASSYCNGTLQTPQPQPRPQRQQLKQQPKQTEEAENDAATALSSIIQSFTN